MPTALARRHHFADDAGQPVFALARKPRRAHPQAGFDEDRAMLLRPVMQRRLAHRLEMMADERPGKRAEGDRRVIGPEGRGADLVHGFAGRLGEDGDGIDIAELALVGRHAGRRVALGELDIAIAFLRRERQILGRYIVLVIDEGLAGRLLHPPQRRDGESLVPALGNRQASCPFRRCPWPAPRRRGIPTAASCRGRARRRESRPDIGRHEGGDARRSIWAWHPVAQRD